MVQATDRLSVRQIDQVLKRFVNDRLNYTGESFRSRFLSYLHLTYSGESLTSFLTTASCVARINMVRSRPPRRHLVEIFQLLLDLGFIMFGLFLVAQGKHPHLGSIVVAGALVHGVSLVQKMLMDLRDKDLELRIYGELHHIIDGELREFSRNGSEPLPQLSPLFDDNHFQPPLLPDHGYRDVVTVSLQHHIDRPLDRNSKP